MIRLDNIRFSYPGCPVLSRWSGSFPKGGSYALLGPSGCGKTTLLKILAGLISPDEGVIEGNENCSILFQEPRLIPWRSLEKNLELPLKRNFEKGVRKEKIAGMLFSVDLEEWAESFPWQLSGGMQQRASMARAFLYPSDILLMDEPYRGLDLPLKQKLIALLRKMLKENPRTLIAVTHQVEEALMLAEEIRLYRGRPFIEEHRWVSSLHLESIKPYSSAFIKLEGQIRKRLLKG